MQHLEETTPSTSQWYSIDEKTASKVGFLICCLMSFLALSMLINSVMDFEYQHYIKQILKDPALIDLFNSAEAPHIAVLIPSIMGFGLFSIGGALCMGNFSSKESNKLEVAKTVIYGVALAAVGFFLGMAITGSIVHNEAWFELKKIEALTLTDIAEDTEKFGFAMAPIAGIAFGGLVLCSNLVDQFAKWCLRRLQRKQEEQASGAVLNGGQP